MIAVAEAGARGGEDVVVEEVEAVEAVAAVLERLHVQVCLGHWLICTRHKATA